MAIGSRKRTQRYEHASTLLTDATINIGGEDYLAQIAIRPSTPTIYNVSTVGAGWTAVATGLTNVLSWRLSEASGADFFFAFEAVPTTQATAFGWVSEQSDISAIYVKRKDATNIDLELLVWKI